MSRKRIVGGRASLLGCALLVVVACGTEAIDEPSEETLDAGASIPNKPDVARGGTGVVPEVHNDGGEGGRGVAAADQRDAGAVDGSPGGASNEPDEEEPEVLALGECDLNAPFDAPIPAFTGTMNADGLTFSADGQTAYVSGVGTNGYDIFVATRDPLTGQFSTPALLQGGINGSGEQRAPTLSPDGTKLYFTHSPAGWRDIAYSVKQTNGQFGAPQAMATGFNHTGSVHDQDPFWWNGSTPILLFASERPSGEQREVYYATGVNAGAYSTLVKLPETTINSPSFEDFRPILSPDGLTLYFASKRTGIGADGDGDVFMSKRTSLTAQFPTPVNVWSMNSSGAEFPVYVTPDGCSLYFASNEEMGLGSVDNYRLYESKRGTSTPAQVSVTFNIIGTGTITSPSLPNCAPNMVGQCTISGPPGGATIAVASGLALWTGICTGNGGSSSSDGVVAFAKNGVCTIKFGNPTLVPPGGACSLSMDCQEGLVCSNGTCGCAPGSACGGFSDPCEADGECQSAFLCVNGTCRPPECRDNPILAGCGLPNSRCGPCTKNPYCESDADCPAGLVCPLDNGWHYLVGDLRVCEDPRCLTEPEVLGCGTPTSPCGLCPKCIPHCENKHCGDADLGDGCGNLCTGLCPPGDPAGCTSNTDCQAGNACLPVDLTCHGITCMRTCRPADPCLKPNLAPPDCGSSSAVCGPSCPPPEQPEGVCNDRVCGTDPVDGISCGTCAAGDFCTQGGRCAHTAPDDPVIVPPGRTVTPEPSPPASSVGSIPGQFAVTDRGSASYTMPIEVPPGRAGIQPALALRYTSGRANGAFGLGFRLDGLSEITACGQTYAEDGRSAAPSRFEPALGDAFCMEGQRLVPVGHTSEGTEYRTSIDGFTKVVLPDGEANYEFLAYTKDGRILTYGGLNTTALVRLAPGMGTFHTYALSKVADRSGNFMRFTYEQVPAVENPALTAELLPKAITYTGHGSQDGDREVFFVYESRPDTLTGWQPGGLPFQRTKRAKSIEVRARGQLVRRYEIRYDANPALAWSRIQSVQEATSDLACSTPFSICKPATSFEYYDEEVGFGAGVNLDGPMLGALFLAQRQGTPFGVVHRWYPDHGYGTRAPQLGVLPEEERRADLVTPYSGSASVTLTTPIPGEVGLGLNIGSIAYSNPWLSAVSVVAGVVNWLFGEEEVETSYSSFTYNPLFQDPDSINFDFVSENSPRPYMVVGPTGGEKLGNATSGSSRRAWLIDLDGDGVQDNVYCNANLVAEDLSYKLANAAAVPANEHPAPPVGASASEATGSIAPIFSNLCQCTSIIGGCSKPPTLMIDVDGDGTRNLIFEDDHGSWAALDFTSGSPVWRTDWFEAMNHKISTATHYLLPADVNGDGLRDILALASKQNTTLSYVAISTGKGFDVRVLDTVSEDQKGRLAPKTPAYIVDLDHDGKEEMLEAGPDPDPEPGVCGPAFLVPNVTECTLLPREWFVRKIENLHVSREPLQNFAARLGSMGDFDGDGNLDILALGPSKTKLTLYRGAGRRDGFLKSVTDGFGRRVDVSYDNKDQQGGLVFTSGSPSASNPVADPTCRWPIRCSEKTDTVLVSSHEESHYLTFSRNVTPVVDRRARYHYKGTRTDIAGLGWLGFWERTITKEDGEGQPIGDTTLRYFPPDPWNPASSSVPYVHTRAGLVKELVEVGPQTTSSLSNGSDRLTSYTVFDWQTVLSSKTRPFPFLHVTTKTVSASHAGATDVPLYRQTTTDETDAFGNVFSSDTLEVDLTSSGTTVGQSQTASQVTRVYNPTQAEIDDWLVGLVKSEIVSATPRCTSPGECQAESRLRTTTFQYVPHTALVQFVNRQPGDAAQARVTELQRTDGFGNVTGVITTDLQGNRRETQTVFDARGLFPKTVTVVGEGLSQTTQVRYDDRFGNLTISADPNGIDQTYTYDAFGIERHYRGDGNERVTNYFPTGTSTVSSGLPIVSGYRINVAISNGAQTETHYDPFGQVVKRTIAGFEGAPVIEELAYDRRQRLASRTRPHLPDDLSQGALHYHYDLLDRVFFEDHPDGGHISVDYALTRFATTTPGFNVPGAVFATRTSVSVTTDPTAPLLQKIELADRNRTTVRVLDGLGQPTDYAYGAFGELRRIQDAAGRVITQGHDDWSRTTYQNDLARGGMETREYNGLDEVVHTTDASTRTRDVFYDDFGRVDHSDTHFGGQAETTQWSYDGDGSRPNEIGRVVEMLSPSGQRTTYRYEPPTATRNRGFMNRTTRHLIDPGNSVDTRDLTTDYTFEDSDISGRLERIDYPEAFGSRVSVKHTEDGFGHLVKVSDASDPSGNTIHWQFVNSDQGYRLGRERVGMAPCGGGAPAGTVTQRLYDDKNGKLETITTSCGATLLQSLSYEHDLAGRTTRRVDANGRTEDFQYDALSRVKNINDSEPPYYAYDPDGRGRLTSLRSDSGTNAYAYRSTGRDWIQSAGSQSYTQDLVGNVKTRAVGGVTQTFTYGGLNLPTQISTPTTTVDFAYDAAGERVVKSSDVATTFYAGKHHQEIEGSTGSSARSLIYVGSRPVAQVTKASTGASTVRYLYSDVLGSIHTTTDAGGAVESVRDFSPFGEQRNTTASMSDVPYGFTGHEEDVELGLTNMKARLYDARLGQFLQADPLVADSVGQGLNRYAYVNNSPLDFVDPSGMKGIDLGADDIFDFWGRVALGALMYQVGGRLAYNYGDSPWLTPEQKQFHGALNGALSGYRRIYSFDADGAAAFFLDSTHGITGTAIGNYINVFNMSLASVNAWDTDFDEDMSEGSNAHVYHGGFRLMNGYAHTQGNVMSNMSRGNEGLFNHEKEHIWQSRLFGPAYQLTYADWFVFFAVLSLPGELVTAVGPEDWTLTHSNIGRFAYYSNPWEAHAYCENNPWAGDPQAINFFCNL